MAKPNWITIISGPTGSSSGTRSLKASSNTGRSNRSGSIKGVTSGGASDSVVLSQVGASEFIMVDKTSYSVTALGGTVKITGTSNSPSLKIYQLSDPSSLSNFALKVNGTAYSWDGNSSHEISGDPGASSSYTFEISFDVAENQTEGSKDITFMLTDSGNRYPSSDEITITQAAGVKTMGDATISFIYQLVTIPASGGSSSPSLEFSIPWGWNGRKSGGGTYTKDNINYTAKYSLIYENEDPYNWSIDENTGVVTADSLGTNVASEFWQKAMVEITVKGKVYDEVANIFQDKNDITSSLLAEVTLDDIPASGGSADSPTLVSATGRIDYSSGESQEFSLTSSDVTITLSKTVNGSNLGSTIKARTKLDTVTATITWNGSKVTQNIDVYQQANQVTIISPVNASPKTFTVAKTGGSFSVADSPSQTKYFSSGTVVKITDFAYSFSTVPSYVSIDELSLTATVGKNLSGSKRADAITVTITGEGNNSTDILINFSQEFLIVPTWTLGTTETFDKDSTGITVTISDPDSLGYKVTVSEAWIEYSNNKIICRSNLTGLSRTGTVQLVSSDEKTVYATCTITQESMTLPSWDVPSTFRYDSLGQSGLSPAGLDLNISDPDNVGWIIEGPSYVKDSLTEDNSLPISGTGDKIISLTPGVNTSSERTFDLVLKASTGDVIATCNCTQDAQDATWDLPSSLTFEACGDGVLFNIRDFQQVGWRLNLPDWCVVDDGVVEGSGDHTASLVAGQNDTGSSRTGTVQLLSTDGNIIYAICTVTQADRQMTPYVTANISLGSLSIPFDVWNDNIGTIDKIRIIPIFMVNTGESIESTEFVELPMPDENDYAVAHPVLKCDNVQLLSTDVITGIEFKIVNASDLETEYFIQTDAVPVSMNVHSSLQPDKTFVFKADGLLGGWYPENSDKITLVNGVNVITINSTSPVITVTSIS